MPNDEKLIGDAGSKRFSAASMDALIAWVPAMIAAANLRQQGALAAGLAFTLVFLGYFVVGEGIWSTTIGKRLMGLRVLNLHGARPSLLQVVVRNIVRLIDANPILLGAIPGAVFILVTPRRQRLGDLVSGTIVAALPDPSLVQEIDSGAGQSGPPPVHPS